MKLNEMKNKITGLPDGFSGTRVKWNDVKTDFKIEKAAILERDKISESGELILYQRGPRQGHAVQDRQLALQIVTEDGKKLIVRTNSPRLTSLYTGDLDRDHDGENAFGDRIYFVDPPEGVMHFIPYEVEGKDKTGKPQKWNVADLEEAE